MNATFSLIIGFLVGTLSTWLISRHYYNKSNNDLIRNNEINQSNHKKIMDTLAKEGYGVESSTDAFGKIINVSIIPADAKMKMGSDEIVFKNYLP